MSTYYESPRQSTDTNTHEFASDNWHKFEYEKNLRGGEERDIRYGGMGSLSGEAAAGGIMLAAGAMALFGLFLYWFYTKTAIGRKWFRIEMKILTFFGALFLAINVLPFLIGSLFVPFMLLWDPAPGDFKSGPAPFIFLVVVCTLLLLFTRRTLGRLRSRQVEARIVGQDAAAFQEGDTTHRFSVSNGRVRSASSTGTPKKPAQQVELETAAGPARIYIAGTTPLAAGTTIGMVALQGKEGQPLFVYDSGTQREVVRLPNRPWWPPAFKRMVLCIVGTPLLLWLCSLAWDGVAFAQGSRFAAAIAAVHIALALIMAFRVPKAVRDLSRTPEESAQLYTVSFFPALVQRAKDLAGQKFAAPQGSPA